MNRELDVSTRRATAGDAALLARLGAQTFFETFASDNTEDDMAAYLATNFNVEQQTAELLDHASTLFIAEVEGVAGGYAKLKTGPPPKSIEGTDAIELVRLYVLSEWLGCGVGERLMRVCVDEARRAGYKTIWLGVWERNLRAQAFYRKWDFRAVGEHAFQLGSDVQTDVLMQKDI